MQPDSLTKADIQEMFNNFHITFGREMSEMIKSEIVASEVRRDIKDEQLERRMDDRMRQYRDEILTKMDGAMKELKTNREEQTIINEEIDQINDKLAEHDKRIKRLENPGKTN